MTPDFLRIAQLVDRYIRDEITLEEIDELMQLQQDYPLIKNWLDNKTAKREEIKQRLKEYRHTDLREEWEETLKKVNVSEKPSRGLWPVLAASVILIFFLGIWGVSHWRIINMQPEEAKANIVIVPGRDQALLTLANGHTVLLGDTADKLVREGDNEMKITDNKLDYAACINTEVHIHKLYVPLGGIYRLQLSDGTNVWLNSDSELEYPSTFTGKDRQVRIRGEAYFEVAKDLERPFKVNVNETVVEALGTAFNINSHLEKDKVKTILTEGRIRVSSGNKSRVIVSGQSTLTNDENIIVSDADIEEALAWKEGYFYFGGKNLKDILSEISRWYNVRIEYKTPINGEKYKGGIKRVASIQSICAALERLTGYDIQVKDRTLVVM
ncbi:fec operon regulator FecR [Sphingobacterium spiritivorum]|uniref:Fec operon regulator FecR n=1 Tax=Sphingobacterium spiritivorum TaxID=258 RepID=A0A380BPH5_SPHSI|nr:FecR domain-containing protein [Sphingobacterium spiritivorum]SUJ04564.1 fec operon regulator FecR [Sphingobacterium spiritivorum]